MKLLFVESKKGLIAKNADGKVFFIDRKSNIHKPGIYDCTEFKDMETYSFVTEAKYVSVKMPSINFLIDIVSNTKSLSDFIAVKRIGNSAIIFDKTLNMISYFTEDGIEYLLLNRSKYFDIYKPCNFEDYIITDFHVLKKIFKLLDVITEPLQSTVYALCSSKIDQDIMIPKKVTIYDDRVICIMFTNGMLELFAHTGNYIYSVITLPLYYNIVNDKKCNTEIPLKDIKKYMIDNHIIYRHIDMKGMPATRILYLKDIDGKNKSRKVFVYCADGETLNCPDKSNLSVVTESFEEVDKLRADLTNRKSDMNEVIKAALKQLTYENILNIKF